MSDSKQTPWVNFSERIPAKADEYFVKEVNGGHRNNVYVVPHAINMEYWKNSLWLDEPAIVSLLSELEQLREENERLKQQAGFSEEIKKQMQVRISDEMVRTFNRDQNITQLENLCRSKDMQIEKLQEDGKQSLLLYNSMTKNIEQLQEYIGHQEGHVNAIKEDRDNFAISFAVWAMHNTQAQAYQAAGISAYDLLEKYKSRPFIDIENTSNQ